MSKPDMIIRPLTPAGVGDFMKFFDGEAFADNPNWRHCYCNFLHNLNDGRPWSMTTSEGNRAASHDRICAGAMHGYLAFEGDRAVGWCQAAPRIMIPGLSGAPDPHNAAAMIGSIVCFVIAKPYRRQGLARLLLATACEGFRTAGLKLAEPYPRSGLTGDGENHYGPMSLYVSAGFVPVANDPDGAVIVRKAF